MRHLVIIPACDEAQNIDSLLQELSVALDSSDLCLVFDNASTDSTREIVLRWVRKDSRFNLRSSQFRLPSYESWLEAANSALAAAPNALTVQFLAGDDHVVVRNLSQELQRMYTEKLGILVPEFFGSHTRSLAGVKIYEFKSWHKILYPIILGYKRESAHILYSIFSRQAFDTLMSSKIAIFRPKPDNDWWVAWWALSQKNFKISPSRIVYLKSLSTRSGWTSYHGFSSLTTKNITFWKSFFPSAIFSRIGFKPLSLMALSVSIIFGWLRIAADLVVRVWKRQG